MLKFKTLRISEEWMTTYPPLRGMVLALEDYSRRVFGKRHMTVTCLSRSKKENAAEGGHPKSLHLALPIRAVDIRIWGWKSHQLEELKKFWDEHLRLDDSFDFVVEKNHIHVEADRS